MRNSDCLLPYRLLFILVIVPLVFSAHPRTTEAASGPLPTPPGQIGEWTLSPTYTLPGRDRVLSNPIQQPESDNGVAEWTPPGRSLHGLQVTDRFRPELDTSLSADGPFSIELWVNYHVNQRVGALAFVTGATPGSPPHWVFGFDKGELIFSREEEKLLLPGMRIKGDVDYTFDEDRYQRGDFRYWHHLVATFNGNQIRIYRNGQQVIERPASPPDSAQTNASYFEIAAYLEKEPHMELGNLVRRAALYNRALNPETIRERHQALRQMTASGILYPEKLHFTTTAPHLAFPTSNSIRIFWETDRPAAARVQWGPSRALENEIDVPHNGERAQTATITGLEPNTRYYYRVLVESDDGSTLDSQLLAFRTAVEPGDPVVFAAISDTEARPHVNARLAELLWRETPHLLVNAGDLTDGGKQGHRFEWTHEYFAGMGAFMARTPVLPVMGNGEDDFVWFTHYHALPENSRSYYDYQYGDVHFIVLDSNLDEDEGRDADFRTRQKAWFEQRLQSSDALWTVVSFHHPPLPEQYDLVVDDFIGLIDQYEVDLVLVGHHHNYRRTWPLRGAEEVDEDGTVYIQLGGGGGNLSTRPVVPDLRLAKTYQGYSYTLFRILGDRMEVATHDDRGALRDQFYILSDDDD